MLTVLEYRNPESSRKILPLVSAFVFGLIVGASALGFWLYSIVGNPAFAIPR